MHEYLYVQHRSWFYSRPANDGSSIEEHEAGLLLKAIHSTNLPKFVTKDIPLFERIVTDLFPGLAKPTSSDKIFQVSYECPKIQI